jgi:ferredoxin--NADP+ reductase
MSDDTIDAVVRHRRDLTERVAVVRVAPLRRERPDFEAGQAAQLLVADPDGGPEPQRRTYSIASPPDQQELEFFIQLVREEPPQRRLWSLQEGDRLQLSPTSSGTLTLQDVPPDSDLVLIGTGTGLAPFASMVRGPRRWRRCVLVHGSRSTAELAWRDTFERMASERDDFAYVPTLTREPEDGAWDGARGRVQALVEGRALERLTGVPLEAGSCHVFLCGQPQMIDDMETRLVRQGLRLHRREQPGRLHFERWWSPPARSDA